jgi:hypothetical protein
MTKSFLTTLAMAALVSPVLADIPDGHGGRTSPQAPHTTAAPAPRHACCPTTGSSTPSQRVTSPAELKTLGHLAWVSRGDEPAATKVCCADGRCPMHRPS